MSENPCFVYVIAIEGQDLCKVGISNNPNSRLAQLLTGSPFKMSLIQTFKTPDRDTAALLERTFHKVMQSHRSNREWFKIHSTDAVEAMAVNYYSMLRRQFDFDQCDAVGIMENMGIPLGLSCWAANEMEPVKIDVESLQ